MSIFMEIALMLCVCLLVFWIMLSEDLICKHANIQQSKEHAKKKKRPYELQDEGLQVEADQTAEYSLSFVHTS